MVSSPSAHLQNFCWHSTKRQSYLLDSQAWYWTHVVGNDDLGSACSCLGNQGIWLRGTQVHSETLQRGNSSYKFHLPWSTLGTRHLKAYILDYCWKVMECVVLRKWRKGLEEKLCCKLAHCQPGHKKFHFKPSHLLNDYFQGYKSFSIKKILVRETQKHTWSPIKTMYILANNPQYHIC